MGAVLTRAYKAARFILIESIPQLSKRVESDSRCATIHSGSQITRSVLPALADASSLFLHFAQQGASARRWRGTAFRLNSLRKASFVQSKDAPLGRGLHWTVRTSVADIAYRYSAQHNHSICDILFLFAQAAYSNKFMER
jgi:hypothetical protein